MKRGASTIDGYDDFTVETQSSIHLSDTSREDHSRDVQKQSGFSWDEERKMIIVTSDEYSSWKEYVEAHPDAKGLQNKVIENWSDIVLLCGRDRATSLGVEIFEEGANAMENEEEAEVNSAQERSRPSDSLDSMSNKRKKANKDAMIEVVGMIATSFQEFVASKKKEEKPSGIEIQDPKI